ncbi:MAG: phosphate/phosphite/phosphonate ABC transporter substrate-binding protein [Gammaproteobacteria bacterium]|nr:phosphate/phosphite/phosphonate ABC transporter substrate-binding protein [Gammaproteobacteria bacterium]
MKLTKIILLLNFLVWCSGSLVYAEEYIVTVRAKNGIEASIEKWQPTVDYLSRTVKGGHSFKLKPVVSLGEIIQQASRGEFDFLLTNPSSFVEVEQRYGAKALVTLKNKRVNLAQSVFGSVIFTHVKNTDILNVKDLQGKTLMAVSEPAFGGWRVAWLEMLTLGFDPYRELKTLMFAENKTQPEVVFAVRDGKADAGVVRTDQLERMEASGKIDMRYFRVLNNKNNKNFPFFLSTDLYPEWPFAVMKNVPADVAQEVKQKLGLLTAESSAARSGKYISWVPPLDYASVDRLMQRLKVGSYAEK